MSELNDAITGDLRRTSTTDVRHHRFKGTGEKKLFDCAKNQKTEMKTKVKNVKKWNGNKDWLKLPIISSGSETWFTLIWTWPSPGNNLQSEDAEEIEHNKIMLNETTTWLTPRMDGSMVRCIGRGPMARHFNLIRTQHSLGVRRVTSSLWLHVCRSRGVTSRGRAGALLDK